MEAPNLLQIRNKFKELGFTVFSKPFDMNLGAIRTRDNASNKFNDYIFMFYMDDKGELKGHIDEGTTDAGMYYRLHPMNIKGTAIIQHGKQYRGSFTYMKFGGHRGQEAFRQTGGVDYWRDPNRDKYLDFINPEHNKIYNTNGHDMGTIGENVNKWSAGCWGSTNSVMDYYYELAQLQIKHGHGNKFTFTLLHEDNF
tara:strand:+ start:48 stop:638 length:591 start_codon:yes stop_codon:yes gene_type:complete